MTSRLRLPGRLIDRYLLRQMLRPLVLSLTLVLIVLILERVMRLVDLIATQGGALAPVLTMAASLLPHYLGLALPAAFFLSTLATVGRLTEESEIDVLMSSGLSVWRLLCPFLVVGMILALFSIVLFGYLQPHARYGYRAALHTATQGSLLQKIAAGKFVQVGKDATFHAGGVDHSSGFLLNVFFYKRGADGEQVTVTAQRGRLIQHPTAEAGMTLILGNGRMLRSGADGAKVVEFDRLTLDRGMIQIIPFRSRGIDKRELTLTELHVAVAESAGPGSTKALTAELHGRLVRAVSIAVLPLLALSMGMTAKRGRRGAAMVVAAVLLVLYHHTLQIGEGLVAAGRLAPGPAIWLPFLAFTGFGLWVMWRVDRGSGRGPFDNLLSSLRDFLNRFRRRRAA